MTQQQLRFVKVDQKEVPIIVKSSTEPSKNNVVVENSESNQELAEILEKPEEMQFTQELYAEKGDVLIKSNLEDIEPDVEPEDENQRIVDQALLAEKKAINSVGFAGVGMISIILPFFGVLFFLIGLALYSSAKSSRYITPFGEQKLATAKTILIIDSVFLILWTLLFLLIVALIFL